MCNFFDLQTMPFDAMDILFRAEYKGQNKLDVLNRENFFVWGELGENQKVFMPRFGLVVNKTKIEEYLNNLNIRIDTIDTKAEEGLEVCAMAIKANEYAREEFFGCDFVGTWLQLVTYLHDPDYTNDKINFCELLSKCYPMEKWETVTKGSFELAEALNMTRDTLGPDVHDYWYIFAYNPITFYFWILLGMVNFCKRFDIHTDFIDSIK